MVWRCPARPEGKTLPGGRTRQTITDRRNRYNFILIATLFEQSGLISISSPVACRTSCHRNPSGGSTASAPARLTSRSTTRRSWSGTSTICPPTTAGSARTRSAAEVQHVVPARADSLRVVALLLGQLSVEQEAAHPDHRVHGGPDLVAH